MKTSAGNNNKAPLCASTRSGRITGGIIACIIALVVLCGGTGLGVYWMLHKPRAQRRPARSGALLVEVRPVSRTAHQVVVHAMGTVTAASNISIAPRVGGQVTDVSEKFEPGGLFGAGEQMFQIDREDYEIAVQRARLALEQSELVARQRKNDISLRKAELAKTREALKVELGRCAVARREYELLGEEISREDRELVLRKPQLASARAAVEAAEAAVASSQAAADAADSAVEDAKNTLREVKLDLFRTTVKAPFNGTVIKSSIDPGSQVATGQGVARFVGTDEFWVEVLVPVDQLPWIEIPARDGKASKVRIYHEAYWGHDKFRTGKVLRLIRQLEPQGRMARLLVSVEDPLGLSEPQNGEMAMILDAYVDVAIEGRRIHDVVVVDRDNIHDGEKVWVAGADDKLQIRKVKIAWAGRDVVYVSRGLDDGDRLITSDLASPVEGQLLRVSGGEDGKPQAPREPRR